MRRLEATHLSETQIPFGNDKQKADANSFDLGAHDRGPGGLDFGQLRTSNASLTSCVCSLRDCALA